MSLSVEKEIMRMEELVQHFDKWVAWSKAQKPKDWNCDRWEQFCIHPVTLRNLKRSVFGFLFFARDVLNDESNGLSFVPFLFNNSSTLESTFSVLRRTNRDTSLLITKGILAGNMKKAQKIASSKSHSAEDVTEENSSLFDTGHDFLTGPKVQDGVI